MSEIQWYFPETLEEAERILAQEGVLPHGGGTGILRGGFGQIRGLMDVGRLPLRGAERRNGSVHLGAALSYTEAMRALEAMDAGQILLRSLSEAATTPLRNRITLGGSVALFPYWSDLMGPLLALEAELVLAGKAAGSLPLAEYLGRREQRAGSLITELRFPGAAWRAAYHRQARTHTDRPAFTVSVLARATASVPEALRVVVTGCRGRYRRLAGLEQRLLGEKLGEKALAAALAEVQLEFPPRMGYSAEYLRHCALVELRRALLRAIGG
jgi:CO/xanthine dehydrogenase FAD-binding subunit